MYLNQINYNIDSALSALCKMVMDRGQVFESRVGSTRDVTFVGVTLLHPWEREILLSGRKHNLAAQIAETMWVLSGRDDIAWLERYLPRARDFSDDGQVWRGAYGKRLRRWPRRDGSGDVVDQVAHVVRLLDADVNSRRAVIDIYDPQVDTADGKDIPCNDFLTFSIRDNALDLGVTIRSNDLMWGWSGVNVFEWSALQEIVAGVLGVEVGGLHFSITSLHLYDRHWDRAKALASAVPPATPAKSVRFDLIAQNQNLEYVDSLFSLWFEIEQAIREGRIDVAAAVARFPEPMMRSWLRVIQWWWSGDPAHLEHLAGTRLGESALVAMQPKVNIAELEEKKPNVGVNTSLFVKYVCDLHTEKHAAYGDSWKRRGEMLGIMANIARKVDRLGANSTSDESSADTATDLLVYLAKYRFWMTEQGVAPNPAVAGVQEVPGDSGDPVNSNRLIAALGRHAGDEGDASSEWLEISLTKQFEVLEGAVTGHDLHRYRIVDGMLPLAFELARGLWVSEQPWMSGQK